MKNAFFLIGTGMTANSITAEALQALKTADSIYLENYTVNFPYKTEELEKNYNLKITGLDRTHTENEQILTEAKTSRVALLVYGDSLSATTHMQLITQAKSQNIPYKIFHNASIMTTVAETGLSLYKFGKTTSMPNWAEHTNKPTSFMNYIKQNQSIEAHTLILTDIGLEIKNAIQQLQEATEKENEKFEINKPLENSNKEGRVVSDSEQSGHLNLIKLPEKIIAITHAGTQSQKIFYDTPENLANKNITMPFCLIIPSNMSHVEEEALETLKN